MAVDRRTVVRWMALGSVWVAGCGGKSRSSPTSGGDSDAGSTTDGGGTTHTTDSGISFECPTPTDVEGPYYTEDAPERADLIEAGMAGTELVLRGRVLDAADCQTPLAGAVFDAWHADDSGAYDNEGYRLRGKVTCDADGHFTLRTIMPGRYDTRPVQHIHFKVWVGDTERITSQIYFEGDPQHNPAQHHGPVVAVDAAGEAEVILAV